MNYFSANLLLLPIVTLSLWILKKSLVRDLYFALVSFMDGYVILSCNMEYIFLAHVDPFSLMRIPRIFQIIKLDI